MPCGGPCRRALPRATHSVSESADWDERGRMEGAGNAGMCAALAAQEDGGTGAVLEAAP
jgi:hypothetical protein